MDTASSSADSSPKPTIGILSIGEMGVGIATLLRAHEYTVYTVVSGRSQSTIDRINRAEVVTLPSDEALVVEADIVLSIVPPRDAITTAKRIIDASRLADAVKKRNARDGTANKSQVSLLSYVDLNAISPRTAKTIAAMISAEPTAKTERPSNPRKRTSSFPFATSEEAVKPIPISFLDGGIIGGPPTLLPDEVWKKPSIVISGPRLKSQISSELISILNIKDLGTKIGPASALKACFASLSKGMTALSIISYTTAHTCGVLPELQAHLKEFSPATLKIAENGLTGMPPKAYRWVEEMRQIAETFGEEGGFSGGLGGQAMFEGVAEVYKLVTDDTVLGAEKTEKRKRGTTAEDVATCVAEGIRKRRRKDAPEGDLSLTWRGSWS